MSSQSNADAEKQRLNTPLQMRHDELERMQEMLRSMPLGGRVGAAPTCDGNKPRPHDSIPKSSSSSRSTSDHAQCTELVAATKKKERPRRALSDPIGIEEDGNNSARAEAVSKARHVFGEVILGGRDAQQTRRDTSGGLGGTDLLLPRLRPSNERPTVSSVPVAPSSSSALHSTPQNVRDNYAQRDRDMFRFGDDILPRDSSQKMGELSASKSPPYDTADKKDDENRMTEGRSAAVGRSSSFFTDDTAADTINAHTTQCYLINELRTLCPMLSLSFSCSPRDAATLMSAITAGRGDGYNNALAGGVAGVGCGDGAGATHGMLHVGGGGDSHHHMLALEERCSVLEAEVRSLTTRLEKKGDECDKLKDSVAEARQRARAVEASARQQQTMMAQRREEARKHLLTEEGRSAKLAHQNKLLQQELDKLKARLSSALK